MEKVNFDQSPEPIVKWDSLGHYAIRYEIEQVTQPATDEQPERTSFYCLQAIANGNSREQLIEAVIRTKYSVNDEMAVQRKALANEPGADDLFQAYNDYVNYAKGVVDGVLV